ncbi:MAG: hypothetical protein ACOCWA_03250 [Bacteroidota bacterium]
MKPVKSKFRIIDKPYKIILSCFILTFAGLFFAWGSVMIFIKSGANKFANQAVIKYQEDKTESLLMMIFDEGTSIEEKNTAIWALGTLKDEEALSDLQKLDSMIIEDEFSGISEYELNKAMHKIKGDWKGGWRVSQNQE